jgi:hypothetical protein
MPIIPNRPTPHPIYIWPSASQASASEMRLSRGDPNSVTHIYTHTNTRPAPNAQQGPLPNSPPRAAAAVVFLSLRQARLYQECAAGQTARHERRHGSRRRRHAPAGRLVGTVCLQTTPGQALERISHVKGRGETGVPVPPYNGSSLDAGRGGGR